MKKILIIGESCKDIFVYCDATRLAPDLPIPVLNVITQSENEGMARNVYRNILNIYPHCDIITNDNWDTITKTRYMDRKSNHAFCRVDSAGLIVPVNLEDIDYGVDLIVISDYDKGFLTEDHISSICDSHPCVLLDTKKVLGSWAHNAAFIKINDYEYRRSEDFIGKDLKEKIIHTQSKDGCMFQGRRFRVDRVEVRDASGAGDSFMAALAVKYLETYDIEESIRFANKCASQVVRKKGVAII